MQQLFLSYFHSIASQLALHSCIAMASWMQNSFDKKQDREQDDVKLGRYRDQLRHYVLQIHNSSKTYFYMVIFLISLNMSNYVWNSQY